MAAVALYPRRVLGPFNGLWSFRGYLFGLPLKAARRAAWRLVRVYYARVLLARRRLLRGISSAGSVGPPAAAAVPTAFPQLARLLLMIGAAWLVSLLCRPRGICCRSFYRCGLPLAFNLAFCGALAVRGVFIHASVKNGFVVLLRGVALLLRVVSMRGAAFAALLLFGLPGYLLQLCCFAAGGPCAVPAAIPPGAALPPVVLLLFWVSVPSVGVSGRGLLCWGSAAAPHLLQVACSVFGSLRAVLACSVGGPRFGVPSGRGYLFGVLRTLCGVSRWGGRCLLLGLLGLLGSFRGAAGRGAFARRGGVLSEARP